MLLDLLNWWQGLETVEQWFWAFALISNVFFVLYVALQFFGGHDPDMPDGHHGDLDAGFTLLSIRSLLAFGMFMGYTGVVVTRMGAGLIVALIAGATAGVLAAWLAWRLLRLLLRLQSSGTLDMQQTIGQTGEVHLRIPARLGGMGKVMIQVQGALRELDAVSESDEIPTGASILVVALTEHGELIVQPFQPLPGDPKHIHLLVK